MAMYDLPELLNRWKQEQLTETQLLGQLLQHLLRLTQRVRELEQAQRPLPPPKP